MEKKLNFDLIEIAFQFTDDVTRQKIEDNEIINFDFLKLVRNHDESNYKFNYKIYLNDSIYFGNIYFTTYNINRKYIYISINNNILYTDILNYIYNIQNILNLEFINIAHLDLAFDFSYNIINRFYKIIKDIDFDIIVLNKVYGLEDSNFPILNVSSGTRKNCHKCKSFYILNKEHGLKLIGYDKTKEIEDNNNTKQYITDYNKFKHIYRLEIRTSHKLLNDSLLKIGFTDSYLLDIIIKRDYSELMLLYTNLLNRLIRIRYKNKVYSLIEFI